MLIMPPIPPKKSLYSSLTNPEPLSNVGTTFKSGGTFSKKRVMHRASKRKAFVRQSFHADISDPRHYDMVINTGKVTTDAAVEAIIAAVMQMVVER